MPVLIVSENTCPHDGFSRNRSIRPSSSVTTIPNSSGFSTDFKPIVTAAPFSRWNSAIFERSKSQSASPEMTRQVSSRRPLASRTEPAVPSGLSSTEYSMFIPRLSPLPKYDLIACGMKATVTRTSSKPWSAAARGCAPCTACRRSAPSASAGSRSAAADACLRRPPSRRPSRDSPRVGPSPP